MNALHGFGLGSQHNVMNFFLACRRLSHAEGPCYIAEISMCFGPEIKGHEIAGPDATVRNRSMWHGAVPRRCDDCIKRRPARSFLPHDIFELQAELPLACSRFDESLQFTK